MPPLASQQRPASSIRFWGLRTLQEALDSTPAELESLRNEIAAAGFLLYGFLVPALEFAPKRIEPHE